LLHHSAVWHSLKKREGAALNTAIIGVYRTCADGWTCNPVDRPSDAEVLRRTLRPAPKFVVLARRATYFPRLVLKRLLLCLLRSCKLQHLSSSHGSRVSRMPCLGCGAQLGSLSELPDPLSELGPWTYFAATHTRQWRNTSSLL